MCTVELPNTTTTVDHGRTSTFSSPAVTSPSTSSFLTDAEDLEAGVVVDVDVEESSKVVHVARYERDCRICHMSMDAADQNSGSGIELGCCCKEDLGAAHLHCAQAWFKIKGNNTCEICGSTASNVTCITVSEITEQCIEPNEAVTTTSVAPIQSSEPRTFWKGHRFLNFLLACMVFAFVISWLFHFNVPS